MKYGSVNQLKALEAQRLEKQQNVPQEWLDMYVNMKGRVPNPVVPSSAGLFVE